MRNLLQGLHQKESWLSCYGLPLLVGLSLSTGTLFLWWGLHVAEKAHIQRSVEQQTEAIQFEITEQLAPQIQALVRMARHWEQEISLTEADWRQDARLNMEDFRGYQAIAWVEPSSRIRWIVPEEENASALDLNLNFEPLRRQAMATARATGQVTVTPGVELLQGGRGFEVFVPIFGKQGLEGYIVGIFRAQRLFNVLLDDNDVQDYAVTILSGSSPLYSRHSESQSADAELVQESTIGLYGLNWRLRVVPSRDLLLRSQSYLPKVALLSGLSLSWLLAIAVSLAHNADRNARVARTVAAAAEIANRDLEREIGDRRQAERLLESAQERLKHLLTSSPTVLYSCEPYGDYGATFVSDNVTTMLGYSPKEFLNNSSFWIHHVHPHDRDRILKELDHLLEHDRYTYEYRFLHQDGTYRWICDDMKVIRDEHGKAIEIVGSQQDISDRKQAEEKLQQTYHFLQTMVDNLPVAVFVKDAHPKRFGKFILWNKTSEQMFGISAEEAIDKTDYDFFPAEQADFFRQRDLETFQRGIPENIAEESIDSHHLGKRVLHTIKVPISDEKQNPQYLLCISEDITDRKLAALTLQQSLQELANLKFALDASSIVSITNQDGVIQYINDKFCEVSHFSRAELLGQNHRIINSHFHSSEFFNHLWATISKGQVWKGEIRNCTKEGHFYWVDTTIVPLLDNQGEPVQYVAINTDITEKKQLERQFLRAQRMESLGTLAGGIAHDLNNVLAPILMATQLLRLQAEDERTEQWIDIMEGSAKRGADLVKQVLSFARGMEGERIPLELKHIIHELKQIIDETFPKAIALKLDLAPNLWMVCGDATQLHQVMMNLCVNARDAMPKGGTLRITAQNLTLDEYAIRTQIEAKSGSYVRIKISDTGMGIAPHILDRIFEPFFTTKDFGKGTGMGLSTVMGIVKSHNGFITVSSEVGQGSEFNVYLPCAEQFSPEPVEDNTVLPGNQELILIVDDEAAIREITRNSLEKYGYRTLVANDGIGAIALYKEHQSDVDLILVDMMMPEMDGITAMRSLRQINPKIRIIAMSGLVSSDKLTEAADMQVCAFLSKPFTTQELLSTLNQILYPVNAS